MEDVLQRIEQKIDAMGGRLDKVVERFDQVDARFGKVDERFDQVDARFGKVDERFDQVDARFGKVDERLGNVDEQLGRVDTGFGKVDERLNAVESGQSSLAMMVQQQGVLQEALRDDIKQTLEGVIILRESTERRFDEVMAKLDERVQPIELATRYLATKKPKE